MHVRRKRGMHRVMKNVRHLRAHFGKLRKAITGGGPSERMCGNVEFFQVVRTSLRLLQNSGVLAQILQVLRSFLQEEFDGFGAWAVHKLPPARDFDAICVATAAGLR